MIRGTCNHPPPPPLLPRKSLLHLYNHVVVTKVCILLKDQKVNSSGVKLYGPMHRLENMSDTHYGPLSWYIKYLCSIYMSEKATCISCSVYTYQRYTPQEHIEINSSRGQIRPSTYHHNGRLLRIGILDDTWHGSLS